MKRQARDHYSEVQVVRILESDDDDGQVQFVIPDPSHEYPMSEVVDLLEKAANLGFSLEKGTELEGLTIGQLDNLVNKLLGREHRLMGKAEKTEKFLLEITQGVQTLNVLVVPGLLLAHKIKHLLELDPDFKVNVKNLADEAIAADDETHQLIEAWRKSVGLAQ